MATRLERDDEMPEMDAADFVMDDTLAGDGGRVPPQDIDAERALLGSILIDDEVFPQILEDIRPDDFYERRHATIYRAMINLYNAGKHIDLTTVTSELRKLKLLKEIGGAPYLAELSNVVAVASHVVSYADTVKQAAVRRRLIRAGTTIASVAYDGEKDIPELLGVAEKEIFNVSDQNIKTEYMELGDLLEDAASRMSELHDNKSSLRGLKTGFPDIDRKTAGFQKGDLIILGARPSMGKTTLAQNFIYNVASYNKKSVLFFSVEMPKQQIVDRMIADVSSVDLWNIQTGNLTEDDFARIGDAMGEMGENNILIDDNSALNILELRNKARRAKHDHPDLGLVVVDYLQLLQGTDRYAGNRVQELTEISRGLKTLARELEVPVIALAQLNRDVTARDDHRPVLSDIRDSGSIEQDADIVLFLHRPDYYHENEEGYEKTNITELIFAKHRNGTLGKVELYYDGAHSRFSSLDKTHEE